MSGRIRVYDLARELGLTSKELIALLKEEGLDVSSHASAIDDDFADLVREHVIAEREGKTASVEAEQAELSAQLDPDDDDDEEYDDDEDEEYDDDEEGGETPDEIHLKPPIIVRDLAVALGKKPNELIGELMTMNVFAAINQVLDVELVEQVCERHDVTFVRTRRERAAKGKAQGGKPTAPEPEPQVVSGKSLPRPPVVAFLGHVDHGKTSLQDYIRDSRVAAGEAGGITQHIGASVIEHEGQRITFLDTPGHEAFTAMRARGANATDIVVLVVAADDGVMPQTVEAINHARAAGTPIVVAMNKMDLPGANPDKLLLQLQQNEVATEDWGGDVGVARVSAITGEGIDGLLERLLLESEMMELKGNPDMACDGIVIEAQLESGMGSTAHVLVRNGTLKVGDAILSGSCHGRAKALIDDRGKRIKSAGPSTPVKVLGLSGVPEAGERFMACRNEREAKSIAEARAVEARNDDLSVARDTSIEEMFSRLAADSLTDLKVVLKADVQGSLEAISESLDKIESEKITLKVIHSAVGEITENDVSLAAASEALIIGFNVRAMPKINKVARQKGVDVRLYSVIYELFSEVEDVMRGRLQPEYRETPIGEAQILQVFETSQAGRICGCNVMGGIIRVGATAKVTRDDEVIYRGLIQSLRRFKDDVREVRAGLECGIRLSNFQEFEVSDLIEVSELTQITAEL
ncbi:MAG: translation initiation factor IF-2 [Lentisphaerae bacterium]|nr:translation initiation factor IF-2 [Lentisphaerota bacterium]MBT7842182.1 translation initiation factor IF-2 [Lentisphaerota bacterium]